MKKLNVQRLKIHFFKELVENMGLNMVIEFQVTGRGTKENIEIRRAQSQSFLSCLPTTSKLSSQL